MGAGTKQTHAFLMLDCDQAHICSHCHRKGKIFDSRGSFTVNFAKDRRRFSHLLPRLVVRDAMGNPVGAVTITFSLSEQRRHQYAHEHDNGCAGEAGGKRYRSPRFRA